MKISDSGFSIPDRDTLNNYNSFKKKAPLGERIFVLASALLCFVIIIFLSLLFLLKSLAREYDSCIQDMQGTLNSVLERYSYSASLVDYETEYIMDAMETETALVQFTVQNTPRAELQSALDVMTDENDNVEFYYYEDGELLMQSSNSRGLELLDSELRSLFADGHFTQKNADGIVSTFLSRPVGNGRVITMYRDVGDVSYINIRSSFGTTQNVTDGGLLFYNTATGDIISSTDSALTDAGNVFSPSVKVPEIVFYPDELEDFDFSGLSELLNSYQILTHDLEDNVRIVVWHSLRHCTDSLLKTIFAPVLYFVLVLCILVISAVFIRLFRASVRLRRELIHISGRLFIDKVTLRRTLSLSLICVLMLCIVTSYIGLLSGFSSENIEAEVNIDNTALEERYSLEQSRLFYDYRDQNLSLSLDKVSRLIETVPAVQNNEKLAQCAAVIGADEISLYNNSFLSTVSSSGYTGVSLGYQDEELNAQLDALVDGTANSLLLCFDEETSIYDYIVRRRNVPGYIRFRIKNDAFSDCLNLISRDAVLIEADFGDSDKFYYYSGMPDILAFCGADSSELVNVENTLSENELRDGYFGIQIINNTRYYINVKADVNNPSSFFISAQTISGLLSMITFALFYQLLACFTVLAAILCLFCPCIVNEDNILELREEQDISEEEEEESFSDSSSLYRKMLRSYRKSMDLLEKNFSFSVRSVEATCIFVFILFVMIDLAGNSKASLVRYLLLSDWQKGFNIFSLTMIFVISAFIWLLNRLLRTVILSLSSNMGPAGLTFGRLLVSLIRLILLLLAIVLILSQVGVNAGTLLASAGLASVVIGIGAQSTVNDILSGLFIIFEGNFRVGDIVSINGWVGMIKEIGARTTSIESYGIFTDYKNIRVLNNSSLNDITNLSRLSSMANALIPVPYEADMSYVEKLFQTNSAFIREKLPEILDGPFYDGIVELQDSARIIRIRVRCDEASRTYLERRLLQLCTELLESNGIPIPYNQIVLRSPDADRYPEE